MAFHSSTYFSSSTGQISVLLHLALQTDSLPLTRLTETPGLFFEDSAGTIVKVGPVRVVTLALLRSSLPLGSAGK
jgi:hypothetical protein